jgi:hypothetical protein
MLSMFAVFVAGYYSYTVEFVYLITDFSSSQLFETAGVDYNTVFWVYVFIVSLITVGVFELIFGLIYRSLFRKGMLVDRQAIVKTAVRLGFIAGNFIAGIASILYIWLPDLYTYGSQTVNFLIFSLIYTLVFYFACRNGLNQKFLFDIFKRLFALQFGVHAIFAVYGLFITITSEDPKPVTADIVGVLCYMLAVGALVGVTYLVFGKAVKKLQREYAEILPPPPSAPPSPPPPDDEIFTGFGF